MAIATEMYCDGCGALRHYSGSVGKVLMERMARKDGWQIGKYHLCQECKAKGVNCLKKEGWIK